MQRRLKERLIGAAVLVMLAVIFIPMILDDTSHTESTITETNIPAKPDADFNSRIVPLTDTGEELSRAEPETGDLTATETAQGGETAAEDTTPIEANAAAADGETEPAPTGETDVAATGEKQPGNSKGDIGLTAWVVQLGSFSSEKNANNLNDDLHKAGFSSFVEPLKQGTKVIYRVRVGPELLRSDAQALKDRLRKDMKLDGMILSYP